MRRRLFNLAVGVSLLLCLATAALWVGSYWRAAGFSIHKHGGHEQTHGYRFFNADSKRGTILFHLGERLKYYQNEQQVANSIAKGTEFNFFQRQPQDGHRLGRGSFLGFEAQTVARVEIEIYGFNGRQRELYVIIPMWFVTIVSGSLPLSCLVSRLRAQSPTAGCCPVCGYDLRATPDRCPECGTPIPTRFPIEGPTA